MVKQPSSPSNSQKTVILMSSYGLWPVLEYELEIAQQKLDEGCKVVFITCDGYLQVCEANKNSNGKIVKRYCRECKSRVDNGLQWLNANQDMLVIEHQNNLNEAQKGDILNILKLVAVNYENQDRVRSFVNITDVDIYESALSTLITELRIATPDMERHASEFTSQIYVALVSYFMASNYIERYKPAEIYVYNGRFSRYRPMLRLAKRKGILVNVYEYPYTGFERYIAIANEYPHNIPNTAKLIKKVALDSNIADSEIIADGVAWFTSRIQSKKQLEQPMIPTYNYWQDPEVIGYFDESKYNIVFFVSSEHEVCAIEEVKQTHPYGQIDAIQAILAATNNAMIHVRIHPNLDEKDQAFLARIEKLKRHKRVNIIMPRSPIDSYALMKVADLVVTYGSTTGIEAAYLRKPVITVGASFYEEFQATATVSTHNAFVKLLKAAENGDYSMFPPIDDRYAEACRFGYSFVNFGKSPVYLSRQSFSGGVMKRNGVCSQIKANLLIRIYNRIIDLPANVVKGAQLLIDPYKRKKFFSKPFHFVAKKLVFNGPS